MSTDAASNPPKDRKRNLTICFWRWKIGGSLRHPVFYRESSQRERARWAHRGGVRAYRLALYVDCSSFRAVLATC
jgi:hypothetical protein